MNNNKMRGGDPLARLSYAEWNRHCDASDAYHRNKRMGDFTKPPPPMPARGTGKLMVKNLTGGDLPAGSVVQLGDYLLDTDHRFDDRYLWLQGNKPADPGAAERYAILKRPIPQDGIDEAFAAGVCIARINVNDTGHKFATPVDDSTDLDSAESGPIEIISPLSSTGSQQAYVRLGAAAAATKALVIEFELDESMDFDDASADATVISFDQGTDPDPDDEGIEVINPETSVSGAYEFAGEDGDRGAAYLITEGDDEGKYRILRLRGNPMKPLVLFSLDEALTVSDGSKPATIHAQYGHGKENEDLAITAWNMYAGLQYTFAGASGVFGLAMHDQGQNYRIIQLFVEC